MRSSTSGGSKRPYTPKYMAGRGTDAKRSRKDDGGDDGKPTKKPLNGYKGKKYDPIKASGGHRNPDRLDERDLKRRPSRKGKQAASTGAAGKGGKGGVKGGRITKNSSVSGKKRVRR